MKSVGRMPEMRNISSKGEDYAFTTSPGINIRKMKTWFADSSATHHMTDQRAMFRTFEQMKPGIGKDGNLFALGRGDIPVRFKVNGSWTNAAINTSLTWAPTFSRSARQLTSATLLLLRQTKSISTRTRSSSSREPDPEATSTV